jgi:hypothetical protein
MMAAAEFPFWPTDFPSSIACISDETMAIGYWWLFY